MLLLAALNVWTYPRHYTGAFILGNLLFAILMRNELFGRTLYAVVNFLFAKVGSSYPVEAYQRSRRTWVVDTTLVQAWVYVRPAALGWYPLGMRNLRLRMAHLQGDPHLHRPQGQPRCCSHYGSRYQPCGGYQHS